jgi:hypothetical protein
VNMHKSITMTAAIVVLTQAPPSFPGRFSHGN